MTRRTVLFLHHGKNWLRGSETTLLDTLRRLSRRELRPLLLCNHERLADEARRSGVESWIRPWPEIMADRDYLRFDIRGWLSTILELRRLIEHHDVQLIYSNGGLPIQTAHYAARLTRVPLIAHIHAPHPLRYVLLYRMHRATKVIFVSDYIRGQITRRIRVSRSELIHPAIDVQRFAPAQVPEPAVRQALGIGANSVVIGQVGSLIRRKGVDLLINGFARIARARPSAHLALVGDGPERPTFERVAKELGVVERVHFLGDINHPERYYQHLFDVNVLCSRDEAFGVSLIEGGACGLPLLGSATGGIPEIITDSENGLLFPPDDISGLAEALSRLTGNASLRHMLGESARRVAVEQFNIEHHVPRIERVIREELRRASHPG